MARPAHGPPEHGSERPATGVSNPADGAAGRRPASPDAHEADDRLRETVVGSRTVYRGHYLEVRVDEIVTPDGRRSSRDIVGHPGAVAIVALDADDRVLMVRQFRLAAGRTLLEIPAGTLDRAADGSLEDPDIAARRELEEETGYRAASWQKLGSFWTAPGFATELMHLYVARDLSPAHEDRLGPDEDERLELEHLPWREAIATLERGQIADAKSIVGLLWLARILDADDAGVGPRGATAGVAAAGAAQAHVAPVADVAPAGVAPATSANDGPAPGSEALVRGAWSMTVGRYLRATAVLIRLSVATMVFSAAMVGLGILGLATGMDWLPFPAFLIVYGLATLSGYASAPFLWWQARRRPDLYNASMTMEADRSGVTLHGPTGTSGNRWSTFRRVREGGGFFFLDTLAGQNWILPLDAFDAAGLAAFRRLLVEAGFSPDGRPVDRH